MKRNDTDFRLPLEPLARAVQQLLLKPLHGPADLRRARGLLDGGVHEGARDALGGLLGGDAAFLLAEVLERQRRQRHEQAPGEEPPIGLILCADGSGDEVELLRLDESGIRAARYMTELPPRELLEKKLHEALRASRERLASRS